MRRDVTIATPCLNEAEALPGYFRRMDEVRRRLRQAGWEEDLLLVDDGSRDGTGALLESYARARPGTRVVHHPGNLGYGAAIKTALALPATEWIVFVDADTNYDQALVLDLAGRVREETDILNVSIFAPGGKPAFPWHRRLLSRSASALYRCLLPDLTSGVYTLTCGFRWYARRTVPLIFPHGDGFAATAEILLRALQAGLRVEEFPAANSVREQGGSKMRLAAESLAHLRLAGAAFLGRLGPPLPVEDHVRRIGQPPP